MPSGSKEFDKLIDAVKSGRIPNLDDHRPWIHKNALCLKCGNIWVAVYSEGTDATALECPHCHAEYNIAFDPPPGLEVPQGHPSPVPPFDPAPREEWGGDWPDPELKKPKGDPVALQPAHLYIVGSIFFVLGSLLQLLRG